MELWSIDLPAQNNQLLAQQGILQHKFLLAAAKVQYSTDRKGLDGWPFPSPANNTPAQYGDHKHDEELKNFVQRTTALLTQECRAKDGEVILIVQLLLCQ